MGYELPISARKYTDKKWFKLLLASIDKPVVDGIRFPGFPPEELQRTFVGSAYRKTLTEAFSFYTFLKNTAAKQGRPLAPANRFLDFGCGWGRYLRFFWKDIDVQNLYGCDVSEMIVDVCRSLNVPGQIERIDPLGTLPYSSDFFDAGMAYSVFTHLPERVHLHWMAELARTMKNGGLFFLTIEPRRFMAFIVNSASAKNEWHRMLAAHKDHLPRYYQQFDHGQFVFMPTNKGAEEYYGDAVIPLSWMRTKWAPYFEVIDFVDEPKQFWQAVVVVRRTRHPFPRVDVR